MTSLEYELRGVYKMLEYCKRHPSRIYSMGCEIRNRNGHKMYTPIFSFANCRSLVTKHVEALLGICCFLLGRACSQLPHSAFNPNAQTHRKLQLAKTGERSREYIHQRIREVELGTFTPLVFSTSGGMAKSTSEISHTDDL